MVRNATAKMTGMAVGDVRAIPAEIGGGFGGKTIVYLEPLAMILARKSGSPVKMVMSREEVFRATGPTSGSVNTVKIGATKDGRITAGEATFRFQAGAFPGAPARPAAMCAFAPYDIENVLSVGIDVVMNRPKSNAYRAPGSPIAAHAVESVLDELAGKLGLDPERSACKTPHRKAPRRPTAPPSARSALSKPWRRRRRTPITARPWAPTRAGASPAAFGSMWGASPARN
jgi:CO/xanthine dehydrogenase Mo-binding subunit